MRLTMFWIGWLSVAGAVAGAFMAFVVPQVPWDVIGASLLGGIVFLSIAALLQRAEETHALVRELAAQARGSDDAEKR